MLPWFTIVPFVATNSGKNSLTICIGAKTLMSNRVLTASSSVSMAGFSSPVIYRN